MKTMRLLWPIPSGFLASGLLLICAVGGLAQSSGSNSVPVVTMQATVAAAALGGQAGVITVWRAGDPAPTLNVYYCISGTASNGVDYQAISQFVQLSNGVTSNSIVIEPINHGQTNIQTVTLDLCASPLMSPVNYSIGSPDSATVYIMPPGSTNIPPVVRIINPPNGSVFHSPANIPIYAYAADPVGSVATVEFFAGSNSLGLGHPVNAVPPPLPPGQVQPPILIVVFSNYWGLVWTNAPLGTNVALTAQAADNGGATTVSAPVTISVLPPPPPATNWPPIVNIVATDPVAIEGTNVWVWPGETNSPPTWAAWPTAVCRFFTNYGPKSALFTVRRWGDAGADLTVPYAIGGTASNGVDYVAIPGTVTIPSNSLSAAVTILPIDDGPPDITKTVILTLAPSTNAPPDYLLGSPSRAAAIILDSGGPSPVTSLLPDKCFHLVMPGPDAAWFGVESSTDLANWTALCTNQVVNGSIDFVDPDTQTNDACYYRAVPLTNPPSE
jgi:hypothetical protein